MALMNILHYNHLLCVIISTREIALFEQNHQVIYLSQCYDRSDSVGRMRSKGLRVQEKQTKSITASDKIKMGCFISFIAFVLFPEKTSFGILSTSFGYILLNWWYNKVSHQSIDKYSYYVQSPCSFFFLHQS